MKLETFFLILCGPDQNFISIKDYLTLKTIYDLIPYLCASCMLEMIHLDLIFFHNQEKNVLYFY